MKSLTQSDEFERKALAMTRAINKIELCKLAIKEYQDLGLLGTLHAIEQQKMLASAIEELQKASQ